METDSIALSYFLQARRAYLSGRWYTYISLKRPVFYHEAQGSAWSRQGKLADEEQDG